MDAAKNVVLGAPASYPSLFIGLVLVMLLVIVYMWWQGRGAPKERAAGKKPAKKEATDEDEAELDDLIDEIHEKQKKKKVAKEAK
jgi:type VI protein secretion system component VasK